MQFFDENDDNEFEELQLYLNMEVMDFEELSHKVTELEYDMPVNVQINHKIFKVTHVPATPDMGETIIFGDYTNSTFCDDFSDINSLMQGKGYELLEILYKTHELVYARINRRNTVNLDFYEEDE
ncbi:MAG: hypothetical protein M1306_04430 [Candidatus Thermoplasmatota archaeon]|jgi:hypothetical protein|nr:hypothetical protein [Candidatus Thermoplasmatota archaeon]